MTSRKGAFGAVAGLAAAGFAAGVAGQRYAMRKLRGRPEPETLERFRQASGKQLAVPATDGVELHVEIDGQLDSDLTIVLCHGYILDSGCWYYQRLGLADHARLVLWDQRSHGRSGRSPRDNTSVDQLGRDLLSVLDAAAPEGPVVLVGHSMGGMTIMALAEHHPELFGDRVIGVGLISTSAGRLAEVTLGLPAWYARAVRAVAPPVIDVVGRSPAPVEHARRFGTDVTYLMTRFLGFGSHPVSSELVAFVEDMVRSCPVDVIADFYPALVAHDKLAALNLLDGLETLVAVGEKDRVTPAAHSRAIVDVLPGAELAVVPNAGHLVLLECPDIVTEAIAGLATRARRAIATKRPA